MYMTSAAVLFAIFFANVVLGSAGLGSFMGDVLEMLTLFAASIAFVAAVLNKEAVDKKRN